MDLLDIGYGNMVNAGRIVALIGADAAPTKRIITAAREKNLAIDATCGKKTKSVLIMDSGHVILCSKEKDRLARKNTEPTEE